MKWTISDLLQFLPFGKKTRGLVKPGSTCSTVPWDICGHIPESLINNRIEADYEELGVLGQVQGGG